MPADYLSSSPDYGATRDLDHELGFGSPSVGLNDPQLSGREVSNYGGYPSYSGSLTPDDMYGIANRRTQQQLSQQSRQQRTIQAYNPAPYSNLPPSNGGRSSPSFNNYLNPQVISSIYAAQRTPSADTVQYNQRFTQPGRSDALPASRDRANYSTAGQNISDRPLTDVQRYGSTLQGGRWVANKPPVNNFAPDDGRRIGAVNAGPGPGSGGSPSNYEDFLRQGNDEVQQRLANSRNQQLNYFRHRYG